MSQKKKVQKWIFGETEPLEKDYKIGRSIGQPGQFGKAFIATSIQDGKKYAVKEISKSRFGSSASSMAAFKQEVKIMQLLDHPNIVKCYGYRETRTLFHIIMELCPGGELFDRIQEKQNYSEKLASRLLRQVFSALQHMHSKGIAHCDLKPDNFVFSKDGDDADIKTIDFGLSKYVKRRHYHQKFVGTPYYVAPDVLKGHYNEACDMWSLGVVTFVMIFGYPPFHAQARDQAKADNMIYNKILQGFNPTTKKGYGSHFPSAIPVSDSVKDLIGKLLCEPAKRLTADEALAHPWLKGDTAPETGLSFLVLKGLQEFNTKSKFKNEILGFMSNSLGDDEVERLKKEFKKMDEDGNGTVTISELGHILAKQGKNKEEVEAIMKAADVDGDGVLSYSELVMSFTNRKLNAKEERLWGAFCALDLDGNGTITQDELKTILSNQGAAKTDEEIAAMIKEVDVNSDGTLDYEEFIQMMWGTDGSRITVV